MDSVRWWKARAYGAFGSTLSRLYYGLRRYTSSRQRGRDSAFRSLMQSQWWSQDQLEAEQWKRLKAMVTHAYEHVPYYRDLFDHIGAEPGDIRSRDDFAELPLLTKDAIREAGARLEARGSQAEGRYRNHTGGSTGVPLSFVQDQTYRNWGSGELDRNYRMCGYQPGWPQVFLWGSDYDSAVHSSVKGRIQDLVLNLKWYNTFGLTEPEIVEIVRDLQVFRPQLIVGYVSSLVMLVRIAHELGLELPSVSAIQTSAEVLTDDARSLLQDAFDTHCFDRYGCREVGNIAHECDAHDGLHLLMENNYVEFVPLDSGLETYQIVVTNLRNRAMPFLRYATGDTGNPMAGPCSCGRGLKKMTGLDGRVSDIIVAPSGRLIHGEFFTHLFYGAQGIRQFQVEQMTTERLMVRVATVSDADFRAIRDAVTPLILRHGDPGFEVRWERVESIPTAESGKYRFTLSHVPISTRNPRSV